MSQANILTVLKGRVTTALVTEHEFSIEEAVEVVDRSLSDEPHLWDENGDPKDLANYLASDEDDE